MNIFLLFALFVSGSMDSWAETRVRRVEMREDQIVTVRTALGIATIIQVPDRPNSVVVGDQDAFKLEYLDQAITIKPLHDGSKSNLYVYTDYRRYNVQLITGGESTSDYVVYLENPKEKVKEVKSTLAWMRFKSSARNDAITIAVNRLGRAKDGVLLIDFSVNSLKRESFKPEWLWLTQRGKTKPIHNLFFSGLDIRAGNDVHGILQVLRQDIDETEPLRIEIRRKKLSYLTIPKVVAWK